MMKRFLAAIWLTIMMSFPAYAALECRLVVTNAVNVLDQFQHIMQNRPPAISGGSKFVPEQPIIIGVLFSGPTVVNGEVDVCYDVDMTKPDGKVERVVANHPGMRGRSDGKGIFFSSFGTLVFSANEMLGTYKLTVSARDGKGNTQAGGSAEFTLEKLVCDWTPVQDNELNRSIALYYLQPKPETVPGLIRGIFNVVPKLMSSKKGFNPTALYYTISLLLQANPQYLAAAAAQADNAQGGERAAWEFILAAQDSKKLAAVTMSQELAEAVNIRSRRNSPFALESIDSPTHIDMLWSQFFITGRYEPVKRIADQMNRFNSAMTPEEYKAGKQQDEDRNKLKNFLMARAAEWSLASNMKRHPLLAYYVESMIARNELRPEAAERARKLMQNQVAWVKSEQEKRKQAQAAETNKEKNSPSDAGETPETKK